MTQLVGREEAIAQITEKLKGGQQVAICSVTGMGGVGKTELALQYSYQALQTYLGGVCWIDARSQDMGIALLDFARIQLGLSEPPENLNTVPQRVAWVCKRWPKNPILVVLDDVIAEEAVRPYLNLLDQRFRVLITTRLKLGTLAQRMELTVLTEAASLDLIRLLVDPNRIDQQLDSAKALCRWLGYLPLGLELVGRYLGKKPDLSLETMLTRLKNQRLTARAFDPTPDMTAQQSVAAAFELTWQDLPPKAQTLCGVLSIFALAPIPWHLVEQCFPDWEPEELEDCRDDRLMGCSLLTRVGQGQYELHQLIREFFAAKLTHNAELWTRKVAQVLTADAKTTPQTVTLTDLARLEPLLPHLEIVPDYAHLLEGTDKICALIGLARVAEAQCRWAAAERYYERSLLISEEQLGADHPYTASSLNNLAVLYRAQGHYSEAEPLFRRSLLICEEQLGADHPDTATSLNNFAGLYESQGRYSEAEPLYKRSLLICEEQLGADHPNTATSLNNLALLYKSQGRYSEAEPLFKRSLSIREVQLGADHPNTATSLFSLAGLYESQGRYSEAEPLFKRSLLIYEEQLGADHPDTATSLNNLANLYLEQGRYSEAEPLYERSLSIREVQLGVDHPNTATSLNNLALLYESQGRYSEAEPLYIRGIEVLLQALGQDHPNTQTVIENFNGCVKQAVEAGQRGQLSPHPFTQNSLTAMDRGEL